ncbi:hypothetical protein [Cellvibrio sp. pealriver]|uniref:hypothetical protein n=1 Tax=Cellvibrio sp. pealriver TaxID=1622269 RepID=UPI00066FC116|nr:hypothetical protein [Cellvibrio sp. pealriver]
MIQSYHHGRFELFVSLIVISIIALAALGRYAFMAADARILRLEVLSHHFMTGAANVRVQYLMDSIANKNQASQQPLAIADKFLYFSPQGWPASVQGSVASDYKPTDEDCYQLWRLLLQNPAPIAKGMAAEPKGEFRSLAYAGGCRYQYEDGSAYFDYSPLIGSLAFMPESP